MDRDDLIFTDDGEVYDKASGLKLGSTWYDGTSDRVIASGLAIMGAREERIRAQGHMNIEDVLGAFIHKKKPTIDDLIKYHLEQDGIEEIEERPMDLPF